MRKLVPLIIAVTGSLAFSAEPATQPAPVVEPLLSDIHQLTRGEQFERAGEAYFSPDGRHIVFQATPKGQKHYQMFIAPLAGNTLGPATQVSTEPSRNTCGWFSPDMTRFIFATTAGKEVADEPAAGYQREGRDYRWSYPPGQEIVELKLSPDGTLQSPTSARPLTDNTAYDAEGAYTPDGRHIVFTSNRTGDLELWSMNSDGSNPVQLTHTKGYDGGPFVSPDGKRVLYRSDRKENNLLQVFVADLAFNEQGDITGIANEKQLTDGNDVNWGPFWHPGGKWIAWATSKHGHANYEIYLMRADGSDPTRVTFAPGADVLPAFSPDGNRLIWSSKRTTDNTTQVFVATLKLPG